MDTSVLNTTTLTRHRSNFRPDENSNQTLRLQSTVHTFTRNFERLSVFINDHSNARISNLSKINLVPCERCLHPSEKVQEPTSLGKSTGAYIPRKCKGAYIPKKDTGAKSLGNVKGPTPQEKILGPTSLGKGTQWSTSLGNEEAVNTWMYLDFSPVQAPFPCKSKI